MYFLGIETTTQTTRAVILDLELARVVARAEVGHPGIDGLPAGHAEQDPAVWIQAVDRTVRQVLDTIGEERGKLVGMAVSGEAHALVALDADNRIVRPAKTAGDISARRQAAEISRAFGGTPGLVELAGLPVRPKDFAAKLLWLKQHEPYHFQRVATAFQPQDFINYWLTGVKRMDFGGASTTGLLDVRERKWCSELLNFVDPRLEESLPPVRSSLAAHGLLRDDLAAEWGVSAEVIVASGGARATMALVGAGCVSEGMVAVDLRESLSVATVAAAAAIDPRGEICNYCDGTDQWMPLALLNNGMGTAGVIARHYGWSREELERMAAGAEPGAGGLLFLPYLAAERTPALPDACGMFHGITAENYSPANVARATVEGIALGVGYAVGRMRELGLEPEEIRVTGTGSAGSLWRQLLADATGLPVARLKRMEGAALGAAMQAAVVYFQQHGEDLTFEEFAAYVVERDEDSVAFPDAGRLAAFERLISRQQYLVDTLHPAGFL